jgi:peptidoglycan hydrolase-like protein with peptidoglycan-binding domain
MRKTLMACMIVALAAMPLMAGAQSSTDMPEGRSSEGYLFPKDAHPHESSSAVTPSEAVRDEDLIRQAQIALRDAGFEPGRIDGVIGPKTEAALRQFQVAQGLPQTGGLDATTQKQLMAAPVPESNWRR